MDSLKNLVWNGAKLAGCGAVIAGIAFGFAVINTEGGIGQADADVFWTGPVSVGETNQDKFLRVLQREGFSEPQAYDWNGNTMYFAHGQTSEAPRQVSMRLQERMVREGLNKHVYPAAPDAMVFEDEQASPTEVAYATMAMEDFFTGGLIPTTDTGEHIVLNGVELATDKPMDIDGQRMMKMFMSYDGDDFADMFNNVRYIEAFRPEGSAKTHKIAIFGDGETKLSLFQPGAGSQIDTPRGEEGLIPACPGCERNTRFSGKEGQSDYEMYTYNSPDSVENVMAFYRQALMVRGWQPSTGLAVVQQLRARIAPPEAADRKGRMEVYERNGRTIHIHVYAAKDVGSHVNIFTGN